MQINLIIERLCLYYQIDKKRDLANKLGIKPSVLSNWIKRNTIDWSVIFTKCEDIDLNWLVRGDCVFPKNKSTPAFFEKHSLYIGVVASQKEEIKMLNREVGKLQLTIEQLKARELTSKYSIAAEPKPVYGGDEK